MNSPGNLPDELRAILERKGNHPSSDIAFYIAGTLSQIGRGSPGEIPHELFHAVCVLSEAAFPDLSQTDAEILANPSTPDLMRYLLGSLRRYRVRINGMEKPTTADRSNAISEALQMRGGWNDRLGKWGNSFKEKYCAAYSNARAEASLSGASELAAYEAGVEAAYDAYREGAKGKQDEREMRKAKREIRDFLRQEGYGTKPAGPHS